MISASVFPSVASVPSYPYPAPLLPLPFPSFWDKLVCYSSWPQICDSPSALYEAGIAGVCHHAGSVPNWGVRLLSGSELLNYIPVLYNEWHYRLLSVLNCCSPPVSLRWGHKNCLLIASYSFLFHLFWFSSYDRKPHLNGSPALQDLSRGKMS